MAAVNITHTVKSPSGAALQGIMAKARISGQAFRTDHSAVAREQWFTSDATGLLTMGLERTDQVTPAGLYYSVEVLLPEQYGGPELYTLPSVTAATTLDLAAGPV